MAVCGNEDGSKFPPGDTLIVIVIRYPKDSNEVVITILVCSSLTNSSQRSTLSPTVT